MNQGQERFYEFIVKRVQNGKLEEAKTLLEESFARQTNGSFTGEYLKDFASKLVPLLKPESASEVKMIISQFGPDHIKT